jgi:hypothetical protein
VRTTGKDNDIVKDHDSKDNGNDGKDDKDNGNDGKYNKNDGGNGNSGGSGGGKIGGEVGGVARSVAWLGAVVGCLALTFCLDLSLTIAKITNGTRATSLPSPPADEHQIKTHNHLHLPFKGFLNQSPPQSAHCQCILPPQPSI